MLLGRKHLLSWLMIGFFPGIVQADAPDMYWAINQDEGRAGYLLGTIHSEDPRVLEFRADFIEQLRGCGTFAMELVPDLGLMQQLLSYMRLPAGEALQDLVGTERYEQVLSALSNYGVPQEQIATMKPWAAMMTLSVPPPRTGLFLDFALSLRASGYGANVVGLETLEDQLSFLEQLNLQQQIEMLDQALAEQAAVQSVHDEMVDTYLSGSLAALEAVAQEQMLTLEPSTRDYFVNEGIVARNVRMATSAGPLLTEGCTFIAVGALHLPGEEGLIALLRKAGYQLESLPPPFEAATMQGMP